MDTPFDDTRPADEFGLEAVRELLRLISESDVTEIQIERGTTKLHIKRGSSVHAAPMMVAPPVMHGSAPASVASSAYSVPFGYTPPPLGPSSSGDYEPPAGSQIVMSPMVGTFYNAPTPKDAPYVQEGDLVQAGEVVGIVEAMKIMNEIDSEFSGRITRILVSNGQPVEYGQPLMVIEPA